MSSLQDIVIIGGGAAGLMAAIAAAGAGCRPIAIHHLEMLVGFMGEKRAILTMRQVLPWYGKGLRGIHKLMQRVHQTRRAAELHEVMRNFFEECPTALQGSQRLQPSNKV